MKRLTEAGLAGRIVQAIMNREYIAIPEYVTADGYQTDRQNVFPTCLYKNKQGKFLFDAFVQKAGRTFVQRSIRVDRMCPVKMRVRGRNKEVYFFRTAVPHNKENIF
jgi:hypothetical protein